MNFNAFVHNCVNLCVNLGYVVISLFVAMLSLIIIDKYVYKRINFVEEIKKGNIAASIFYSVILLFVAILFSVSMN